MCTSVNCSQLKNLKFNKLKSKLTRIKCKRFQRQNRQTDRRETNVHVLTDKKRQTDKHTNRQKDKQTRNKCKRFHRQNRQTDKQARNKCKRFHRQNRLSKTISHLVNQKKLQKK
jgi:hypothetical protein